MKGAFLLITCNADSPLSEGNLYSLFVRKNVFRDMKSTDGGFKSEHFENIANLKPLPADLILLNVLFLKTTNKSHPTDKGELALHECFTMYSR